MDSNEATEIHAAMMIARSKGPLAVGASSASILHRVRETWPGQHRACMLGIIDERERCARIVEAMVAASDEAAPLLTEIAAAIRAGDCVGD